MPCVQVPTVLERPILGAANHRFLQWDQDQLHRACRCVQKCVCVVWETHDITRTSDDPPEKQELYFLLCDVLPEDRALREKLQQKRLVRTTVFVFGLLKFFFFFCGVLCLWLLDVGLSACSFPSPLRHQEEVLEQQQKEREDRSFHRVCMFCNDEFTGNRSAHRDCQNQIANKRESHVGDLKQPSCVHFLGGNKYS